MPAIVAGGRHQDSADESDETNELDASLTRDVVPFFTARSAASCKEFASFKPTLLKPGIRDMAASVAASFAACFAACVAAFALAYLIISLANWRTLSASRSLAFE